VGLKDTRTVAAQEYSSPGLLLDLAEQDAALLAAYVGALVSLFFCQSAAPTYRIGSMRRCTVLGKKVAPTTWTRRQAKAGVAFA